MSMYRFLFFYLCFLIPLNIWVGMTDISVSSNIDLPLQTEATNSVGILSKIGIFFDIVVFGIFSPQIPFLISFVLFVIPSIIVLWGLIELIWI